ncbi:hypothetical protein ACHAXS_004187 [Conticribra weissflogii]
MPRHYDQGKFGEIFSAGQSDGDLREGREIAFQGWKGGGTRGDVKGRLGEGEVRRALWGEKRFTHTTYGASAAHFDDRAVV